MYIKLGEAEQPIVAAYKSGNLSHYLGETLNLFGKVAGHPGLKGRALYDQWSDNRLQEIAAWVTRPRFKAIQEDVILHVATIVYPVGGHTRVMEDIVRALPDRHHILIMTDVSGIYARGAMKLGVLEDRFKELGIEVRWLPTSDILSRTVMLNTMIGDIAPQTIFVNVHPYDTVAYGAIGGASAPRVVLLHHADHYPALGSSRSDYIHVDLTSTCYKSCCAHLKKKPVMLNMTVADSGVMKLDWSAPLTGVMSGTINKFRGQVGASYADLQIALLQSGVERMHHIGDVDAAFGNDAKQKLQAAGIALDRLLFHGSVPSLSAKLKEIGPSFAFNSHPEGGVKGNIEAISLGLPFIHYQPPEKNPYFGWDIESMGACEIFTDLSEIPATMARIRSNGGEMAKANRKLYEERYSIAAFEKTLRDLIK